MMQNSINNKTIYQNYDEFQNNSSIPPTPNILGAEPIVSDTSQINNTNKDENRLHDIELTIYSLNNKMDYFNKIVTKFYEVNYDFENLKTKVEKIESNKAELINFHNSTKKIYRCIYVLLILAPISILTVIYFASLKYIDTLPNFVNNIFLSILGVSVIINIVCISKSLPKDTEKNQSDIAEIQKTIKSIQKEIMDLKYNKK